MVLDRNGLPSVQGLLNLLEQAREFATSAAARGSVRVLRTLLVFENTPDPIKYPKELVAEALTKLPKVS